MKRILLFVIVLMVITVSAFADKQEWIDKNYDFGKAKNILIMFYVPDELKNGITEKETQELFDEAVQRKLVNKLGSYGYNFKTIADATNDIQSLYGINISKFSKNDDIFSKYIKENIDLVFNVNLMDYSTGMRYKEGYSYTVPKTESHYVSNGLYGGQIVTTHTTEQHYVEPKNVKVSYVSVKFIIDDVTTATNVWTRIGERDREGSNKHKDNFENIINSCFNDYVKKVKKAANID